MQMHLTHNATRTPFPSTIHAAHIDALECYMFGLIDMHNLMCDNDARLSASLIDENAVYVVLENDDADDDDADLDAALVVYHAR